MLSYGFRAYNGVVFSDSQVDKYNALTAQIQTFEKEGREVPANLLNGRNNFFKTCCQQAK